MVTVIGNCMGNSNSDPRQVSVHTNAFEKAMNPSALAPKL